MVMCCVQGCANRSDKGVRKAGVGFHRFPKNEQLNKQWISAMKRPDWTPSIHTVICTEHFSADVINSTYPSGPRLRDNAVPTIFPDPSVQSKLTIPQEPMPLNIAITSEDHDLNQLAGQSVCEGPQAYVADLPVKVEMNDSPEEESKPVNISSTFDNCSPTQLAAPLAPVAAAAPSKSSSPMVMVAIYQPAPAFAISNPAVQLVDPKRTEAVLKAENHRLTLKLSKATSKLRDKSALIKKLRRQRQRLVLRVMRLKDVVKALKKKRPGPASSQTKMPELDSDSSSDSDSTDSQ